MPSEESPTRAASSPQYYFFSGKGGVGKTTLAAATAVSLGRSGKRTLITSTDPAHSLSDVFGCSIGHNGALLEANLFGLEIDSSARWAENLAPLEEKDGKKRKQGRIEKAMTDAVKMLGEAPGVDEFSSLELLIETMTSEDFDAVVFDTAPTGHTLRLLLLPNMLDGWIGRIMSLKSVFSKFGRAMRKLLPKQEGEADQDFGDNMQIARDRISQARQLITDPSRTSFALVTIPEAMSVFETQRTMLQLSEHDIPVGMVFANQVQPPTDNCEHCRLRRSIHERELRRLQEIVGEIPLHAVSAKPIVIRGTEALAALGRELQLMTGRR